MANTQTIDRSTTGATQAKRFPAFSSLLRRTVRPLRSRKVRVALTTALGALAVDYGLNVPSELLMAIVGIGASLILGIAHEDAGRHAASRLPSSVPEGFGTANTVRVATTERSPSS